MEDISISHNHHSINFQNENNRGMFIQMKKKKELLRNMQLLEKIFKDIKVSER